MCYPWSARARIYTHVRARTFQWPRRAWFTLATHTLRVHYYAIVSRLYLRCCATLRVNFITLRYDTTILRHVCVHACVRVCDTRMQIGIINSII